MHTRAKLIAFLTVLVVLAACAQAAAAPKRTLLEEDVGYVNTLQYGSSLTAATLSSAISGIGSSSRKLFMSTGTWTIGSSVVVPSNITLWIPRGTFVTFSGGATLTINGGLQADHDDWYAGAGSIVMNKRLWEVDSFPSFIPSGCSPLLPASSLTLAAFACAAQIKDVGATWTHVLQAAAAVGPFSSGDGTYWVMIYRDMTSTVSGWSRQPGTYYLGQKSSTQPSTPNGGIIFSKVTVSGGVITDVYNMLFRSPLSSQLKEIVVSDYATGGDGSFDNPWTGWYQNMPLGPHRTYRFSAGVFGNSATTNFPYENVTVVSHGALIKHTGSGVAFGCDTGASGPALYNFTTIGKLTIQGNASTTDGVLLRGCHHVVLDKLRVHDVTNAGLRTEWVVELTSRQFTVSNGEKRPWGATGGYTVTPQWGIWLDDRASGEYTSNAIFDDIVIEGVSNSGVHIIEARDCYFNSGTSEGNGRGVYLGPRAARITFNSMDFESNTNEDVSIDGMDTTFLNGSFLSASVNRSVEIGTGQRTKFLGGYIRVVNLQSTSADTTFVGSVLEDHPALGIVGSGSYKAYNIRKTGSGFFATTASPSDHLADFTTFTPTLAGATTAGNFSYGTRTGACSRIGQHVHCTLHIILNGILVAPSGVATIITGLNWTPDSTFGIIPVTIGTWGGITFSSASYTYMGGYLNQASGTITLTVSGSGVAAGGLDISGFSSTAEIELTLTYTAAQN